LKLTSLSPKGLQKEYDTVFYKYMAPQCKSKYIIKEIIAIKNERLALMFQERCKTLAIRKDKPAFQPTWHNLQDNKHRQKIMERMQTYVIKDKFQGISLVPCWHGTRPEIAMEIGDTGFANLAINDEGFFGNGIYTTPQNEYALRVYARECLPSC